MSDDQLRQLSPEAQSMALLFRHIGKALSKREQAVFRAAFADKVMEASDPLFSKESDKLFQHEPFGDDAMGVREVSYDTWGIDGGDQ